MELYHLKKLDGLHPTLKGFIGSPVIHLLSFLATISEALGTIEAAEAMFMRVIAYYLEDEAQEVHEEKLSSATDCMEEELFVHSEACTWVHIVDVPFRRFLTDEELKLSYNSITRVFN